VRGRGGWGGGGGGAYIDTKKKKTKTRVRCGRPSAYLFLTRAAAEERPKSQWRVTRGAATSASGRPTQTGASAQRPRHGRLRRAPCSRGEHRAPWQGTRWATPTRKGHTGRLEAAADARALAGRLRRAGGGATPTPATAMAHHPAHAIMSMCCVREHTVRASGWPAVPRPSPRLRAPRRWRGAIHGACLRGSLPPNVPPNASLRCSFARTRHAVDAVAAACRPPARPPAAADTGLPGTPRPDHPALHAPPPAAGARRRPRTVRSG